MTDNAYTEKLQTLDDKILKTEKEYAEVLAEFREVCEHPVLLETGYQESRSGFFDGLLPLRICEDCGLEEEGWSFYVLRGRAYNVARHDIYRARKRGQRTLVDRTAVFRK